MSKRILYVIPNYECNLKCSHCDIKDLKCKYNKGALIKAITENTYDEVIRLLFKLSELHNGKKECKKIVNNIKKSQPNNITLLRELLYFQKTAY